jgi:hypothetical protein
MGNGQLQILHLFLGHFSGLDGEEQKYKEIWSVLWPFSGAKSPPANWSPAPRI